MSSNRYQLNHDTKYEEELKPNQKFNKTQEFRDQLKLTFLNVSSKQYHSTGEKAEG